MYIIDPFLKKKESIGKLLQITLFIIFIFPLFIEIREIFTKVSSENIVVKREPLPSVDYEIMGKGVMSLSYRVLFSEMIPLVQDLVVIGKNSRPDGSALNMVCLGLKTSGQKDDLFCGQKVFISRDDEGFRFSETKTDSFVTPIAIQGAGVRLDIVMDGKREEVILPVSTFSQKSMDDENYITVLQAGVVWGPDLFLQRYGGDEYRSLSTKCKIEIGGKIYFLLVGDTLWWDGECWKKGASPCLMVPIVKILSSNAFGIKVQVWNESGYVSKVLKLPLQPVSKESCIKKADFITEVRARSPSEITCQLGKRRVTIKEGDWWACYQGRWIRLKNTLDLEAFLIHEISGELVIFEKFENEKERMVLKGVCFDKMRTKQEGLSLIFPSAPKYVARTKKINSGSGVAKREISERASHRSLQSIAKGEIK